MGRPSSHGTPGSKKAICRRLYCAGRQTVTPSPGTFRTLIATFGSTTSSAGPARATRRCGSRRVTSTARTSPVPLLSVPASRRNRLGRARGLHADRRPARAASAPPIFLARDHRIDGTPALPKRRMRQIYARGVSIMDGGLKRLSPNEEVTLRRVAQGAKAEDLRKLDIARLVQLALVVWQGERLVITPPGARGSARCRPNRKSRSPFMTRTVNFHRHAPPHWPGGKRIFERWCLGACATKGSLSSSAASSADPAWRTVCPLRL